MSELASVYLRLIRGMVLLVVIQISLSGIAIAKQALVTHIIITDTPLAVQFSITGKAPVKVIRIGKNEVLVALKNAALAKGYQIQGKDNPAIQSVNIELLEGNVLAVMVTSKKPYGKIDSAFNKANTRLIVALEKTTSAGEKASVPEPAASQATMDKKATAIPQEEAGPQITTKTVADPVVPDPAAKDPAAEKPAVKETVVKEPVIKESVVNKKPPKVQLKTEKTVKLATPPPYEPPKRKKTEFRGDISDLYRGFDPMACEAKSVENAILLIKKELYSEAFEILDQYLVQENFSCLEQVYFLRAFVYYKSIEGIDYARLIKAERMFQDALVSYPKSVYVPHAYSAIGMIQVAMKNMAVAEGYFNIVHQGYPEYSGMPEVQFHLAQIYDDKGYTDKALRLYKMVFESPIENSYIPDAGVGYGKALFQKRQYFDALTLFNYVVKTDVKKVYESPELLMYTANASYELGLSKSAREHYMRVLNLFPDIPDRDMVLSKVGDAYGMEGNTKKAVQIYELVREKFPDTQGFINASIGIARYLETDPEKIEIYKMIKTRFPENTYSRIAMMRLAEIYQKNGEYNKCIQEIEDLLSTHPRGLRYEAVQLMQQAYEALFKKQLKADEFTSVLNRYELEHVKLDKMSSRTISFYVGTAYLEAKLYEESFNHLITAFKKYKRSERSAQLLFGLGRAMDESGRKNDALKLYAAFFKRFPKDGNRVAALLHMGQIYLEKKQFKKAGDRFTKAYALSENAREKGEILISHSHVYEKKGDLKTASRLRENAVKEFASAQGKNYGVLADSYKLLGNTYLNLKSYVQAADAFSKALSFSEGDRAKANIGFLLGDAYQKGNILDKAKSAFEQVATSYDSVWARLAQQRLSTMDLAGKMINS